MGDHRAELTATFKFHGKTYQYESGYVNWDPDSSPCRVEDWLRECWDDGYGRYLARIHRAEQERNAAKHEQDERAELARLMAKYGVPASVSKVEG